MTSASAHEGQADAARRQSIRKWLFWRLEQVDDWTFDHAEKVWDRVPWSGLQSAACLLFGHVPISTCHDPQHDNCAYCRTSMPGLGR